MNNNNCYVVDMINGDGYIFKITLTDNHNHYQSECIYSLAENAIYGIDYESIEMNKAFYKINNVIYQRSLFIRDFIDSLRIYKLSFGVNDHEPYTIFEKLSSDNITIDNAYYYIDKKDNVKPVPREVIMVLIGLCNKGE